jgi:hypothetical protein
VTFGCSARELGPTKWALPESGVLSESTRSTSKERSVTISKEASVIASGTEDEKGDECSNLDGQVSEKKATSPSPSAA